MSFLPKICRSNHDTKAEQQPVETYHPEVQGLKIQDSAKTSESKSHMASSGVQAIIENNKKWAQTMTSNQPDFFSRLEGGQQPAYLYFGCSDSRVPATTLLGLQPGEVFVQRNVANVCSQKDIGTMATMEFAILHLKVKHVLVTGHYNCGGCKGALGFPTTHELAATTQWIDDIRQVRDMFAAELQKLSGAEQANRLSELNVVRQVFNLVTCRAVQMAWKNGQPLTVSGMVYGLKDGLLKELVGPVDGPNSFKSLKPPAGADPSLTEALVKMYTTYMGWLDGQ